METSASIRGVFLADLQQVQVLASAVGGGSPWKIRGKKGAGPWFYWGNWSGNALFRREGAVGPGAGMVFGECESSGEEPTIDKKLEPLDT